MRKLFQFILNIGQPSLETNDTILNVECNLLMCIKEVCGLQTIILCVQNVYILNDDYNQTIRKQRIPSCLCQNPNH